MRLHKILIIAFALTITLMIVACTGQKDKTDDSKGDLPNFVLLMGDDHGWDEVGYNGHPFVKTPVLDEMAGAGLLFNRFYSGHPSCSPTRGSFMTGRHPNRYGTFQPNFSIRPEEITIAQLMKDAGYVTAHFGKWHLGPVKKESPTNPGAMGFDEWLSHDNFFEIDPVLSRNGAKPEMIKGEGSEVIIDEAIAFIRKAKKNNQPFMVIVWYGSPHEPYTGLPSDLALYDDLPDSLGQRMVELTSNETGKQIERPLREVLRERYAEITAMDRSIGRMRDFLEENGLKENTLVWYCGDNGTPPSAGRTGMTLRNDKGSVYEGGVRVPGVIEWPALINVHAETNSIAGTSDILPTLAQITGQPLPDRPLDGISLLPYIQDPDKVRKEPIFFWKGDIGKIYGKENVPYIDPQLQEGTTPLVKIMDGKFTRTFKNYKYSTISEEHFAGERAMTTDRYKLVLDSESPGSSGPELYDILNDQLETTNLANQYPEMVDDMKAQMKTWQASVLKSLTGADYN